MRDDHQPATMIAQHAHEAREQAGAHRVERDDHDGEGEGNRAGKPQRSGTRERGLLKTSFAAATLRSELAQRSRGPWRPERT